MVQFTQPRGSPKVAEYSRELPHRLAIPRNVGQQACATCGVSAIDSAYHRGNVMVSDLAAAVLRAKDLLAPLEAALTVLRALTKAEEASTWHQKPGDRAVVDELTPLVTAQPREDRGGGSPA